MEIQIKFTLKLHIDEWGMYKKGDTEEFFINVFDERNGLVWFPIDKRWDIVSKEIVRVDNVEVGENTLPIQRVRLPFPLSSAHEMWQMARELNHSEFVSYYNKLTKDMQP